MFMLKRSTLLAAAIVAATVFVQPVQSATVQPSLIVSDVGNSAKLVDVVRSRRGGGAYWRRGGMGSGGWGRRGFANRGWGGRGWGNRRFAHRGWGGRGWGHRGWGHRRFVRRGWGWGGPVFGLGVTRGCPIGFVWTYRFGCVPW